MRKTCELLLGVARRRRARCPSSTPMRSRSSARESSPASSIASFAQRDRELAEAVEPLHPLALQKSVGIEVVHLGRVVAAEDRRIEARDASDRRTLRAQAVPQPVARRCRSASPRRFPLPPLAAVQPRRLPLKRDVAPPSPVRVPRVRQPREGSRLRFRARIPDRSRIVAADSTNHRPRRSVPHMHDAHVRSAGRLREGPLDFHPGRDAPMWRKRIAGATGPSAA